MDRDKIQTAINSWWMSTGGMMTPAQIESLVSTVESLLADRLAEKPTARMMVCPKCENRVDRDCSKCHGAGCIPVESATEKHYECNGCIGLSDYRQCEKCMNFSMWNDKRTTCPVCHYEIKLCQTCKNNNTGWLGCSDCHGDKWQAKEDRQGEKWIDIVNKYWR